jgi:hypothetical protein
MKIVIEPVNGEEAEAAMWQVRREVFEREMGIQLAPPGLSDRNVVAHLLARTHPGRRAVGTLSVVDTSGDRRLHDGHNLGFEPGARAARFTHLAVLRPLRGRHIPLMMMLEAHRLFVAPGGYDYTWLLFDAERAPASFLTRLLGFTPKADVFVSEYGRRCPLVRDERAEESRRTIRLAEQFLKRSGVPYVPWASDGARCALSA